jgi:uncharacterized membrane protein YedE/YeeE
MMKRLIPLGIGLMFGGGLSLAGMTESSKVLGFLDLFGAWDPSLGFVMGGAIAIGLVLFRIATARQPALPKVRQGIDVPLVIGAALFGIGWGLVGLCPGPAIANIGFFDLSSAVFVLAMIAGMALAYPLTGTRPDQ